MDLTFKINFIEILIFQENRATPFPKINEGKEEVFIYVECNTSNETFEKNEPNKGEEYLKVNISDYSEKPAEENNYNWKKDINILSSAKGEDIKNKKKITLTILCWVSKGKIQI